MQSSRKTRTRPGQAGRPRGLFGQAFFPLPLVASRGSRLLVTRNSYANRRVSRPRSRKVTTSERGRHTKGSEQTCRPADNATEEKTGRSLRSAALTAVSIYTWRAYCPALYRRRRPRVHRDVSILDISPENCHTTFLTRPSPHNEI